MTMGSAFDPRRAHHLSLLLALGSAVGILAACRDDETGGAREPRAVVDLTKRDLPSRRGVEPSPERGEDSEHRAGRGQPDERGQTLIDLRARTRALDLQLEQRGETLPATIGEERRAIDRDLEALEQAPEGEWKTVRDRIAERIDALAAALAPAS
jgi:hypothetical protein